MNKLVKQNQPHPVSLLACSQSLALADFSSLTVCRSFDLTTHKKQGFSLVLTLGLNQRLFECSDPVLRFRIRAESNTDRLKYVCLYFSETVTWTKLRSTVLVEHHRPVRVKPAETGLGLEMSYVIKGPHRGRQMCNRSCLPVCRTPDPLPRACWVLVWSLYHLFPTGQLLSQSTWIYNNSDLSF